MFQWETFARRSSGVVVVITIHIAALYVLMQGAVLTASIPNVVGSAVLLPVNEVAKQRFSTIDVVFRKPDVDLNSPEVEWQAPLGAPAEIQPMVTIGPRLLSNDAASIPADVYPLLSLELGEEGVVEISLQVLADGSIGDVLIDKSSGYARLDQAAEKYIREHWRFAPGLRDGEPYVAWRQFRMAFHTGRIDVSFAGITRA